MVDHTEVRLYVYKSRHSVNLPTDFIRDSQFPFKPGQKLIARIDGDKVILEKAK